MGVGVVGGWGERGEKVGRGKVVTGQGGRGVDRE